MARGAFGDVQVQLSARPRSRSMLVEVSGPCGTASNTLRPKRLPIHIGSAGERARPPVQSFFVLDQMNQTEPKKRYMKKTSTQDALCVRWLHHLTNWTKRKFSVFLARFSIREIISIVGANPRALQNASPQQRYCKLLCCCFNDAYACLMHAQCDTDDAHKASVERAVKYTTFELVWACASLYCGPARS
jgi:hypothetical protein